MIIHNGNATVLGKVVNFSLIVGTTDDALRIAHNPLSIASILVLRSSATHHTAIPFELRIRREDGQIAKLDHAIIPAVVDIAGRVRRSQIDTDHDATFRKMIGHLNNRSLGTQLVLQGILLISVGETAQFPKPLLCAYCSYECELFCNGWAALLELVNAELQ